MGRRTTLAALALALAVAVLAAATALAFRVGGDSPAVAPPRADVAALDGAALFAAKGCAVCHLGPGPSAGGGGIGPDLRRLTASPAYVRESILEPAASVAGGYTPMPGLPVSRAEADALTDHLLGAGAAP